MGLTEEERKTVVKYRLECAYDTLLDVKLAIQNKRWKNAANRLYYACYYAAIALLLHDGYVARTHSGVKTLLGLHYEKEKIIDEGLMKAYKKMFNLRQTGDYDDMVIITEDDVMPLVAPAEKFIAEIENLINKNQ